MARLKSMIEILFSFFIVLSDNRLVEIENFKIEILLFRSRRASIFFFRREFVEDRLSIVTGVLCLLKILSISREKLFQRRTEPVIRLSKVI